MLIESGTSPSALSEQVFHARYTFGQKKRTSSGQSQKYFEWRRRWRRVMASDMDLTLRPLVRLGCSSNFGSFVFFSSFGFACLESWMCCHAHLQNVRLNDLINATCRPCLILGNHSYVGEQRRSNQEAVLKLQSADLAHKPIHYQNHLPWPQVVSMSPLSPSLNLPIMLSQSSSWVRGGTDIKTRMSYS